MNITKIKNLTEQHTELKRFHTSCNSAAIRLSVLTPDGNERLLNSTLMEFSKLPIQQTLTHTDIYGSLQA